MVTKTLLVTGATGKQGRGVIDAVLASQGTSPTFSILGLTRNAESSSAKALAQLPGVKVLQGDLDDCAAIFKSAGAQIWGVFSVQVPLGGKATVESEERQGKDLASAAAENGVSHFVYSSVDRGGRQKSDNDPTNVPHFKSKFNVEKHLLRVAAASPQKMGTTILRPAAFFDNLTPDMMGKVFATMWKGMGDKKLQFVSTRDIGFFAARAFERPEQFNGQAISLAGDDLTQAEADKVFRDFAGHAMPTTFGFIGSAVRWGVGDLGAMMTWFEKAGYGADIQALRKQDPELQDLAKWLRESSGFKQ